MIRPQYFASLVAVACCICQISEASAYQAILLDAEEKAIIQVDIDTSTQTLLPVIPLNIGGPLVFAADVDGSIFVTGQGGFAPPTDLARFNPSSGQRELSSVEATFTFPSDMDIAPDGDFVVVDEFTLKRIDGQTGAVDQPIRLSDFPDLDLRLSFRAVEIDSEGAIITDFLRGAGGTTLVRRRPGVDVPDTIDTDVTLLDYVLETDDTLIGLPLGPGRLGQSLLRIDLRTGESEVIFENELLSRVGRLAIDPIGRILGVRNALQGQPKQAQLVRIDLASGNMDIVDLGQRTVSDLDILIPEPSAFTLLAAGFAGLTFMVAGSRHRTTFSQRAKI